MFPPLLLSEVSSSGGASSGEHKKLDFRKPGQKCLLNLQLEDCQKVNPAILCQSGREIIAKPFAQSIFINQERKSLFTTGFFLLKVSFNILYVQHIYRMV